MIFLIFALAFGLTYPALDAVTPALHLNKIGGLLHWRCGRIGGSFYLARIAR